MNQHAAPPEFAMSFTHEAVLLECRDGHDWRLLGQVRFAGREMTARLNALRDEAGGEISFSQPDTVLVIPEDQILYTTLTVPVGADTAALIGRALEAATPYQASDLAFDWCPAANGDIETLQVAAVARRTLDEAEDFARSQGFRPSGFVARPSDGSFDGQPDFGPSRLALEGDPRPPFSEPDLTQARITDPVIAAEPVVQPQSKTEPAVVISRVTQHYIAPAPAAASPAAPVVAAPEDTETTANGVIRHGTPRAPAATPSRMSPRAEAVHARAREARERRAAEAEDDGDMPLSLLARLKQLDPARLPVLIGGLVAALAVILLFFGGAPAPQQTAEPQQAMTPTETPIAEPAPVETAVAPVDPAPVDPALVNTAPLDTAPPATAAQTDVPATAPVEAPALADSADPALAPTTQPLDQTAALPESSEEPADVVATTPPTATPLPGAVAPSPRPATAATATPATGDDALSRALAEAMTGTAAQVATAATAPTPVATVGTTISAATMSGALSNAPRGAAPAQPAAATPRQAAPQQAAPATRAAPAAQPKPRLNASARPPRAQGTRAAAAASPDSRPAIPANPQPYAQRNQAEPPRVTGSRPPSRPAAAGNAAPAVTPARAPATAAPAAPRPVSAPRPRSRPAELGRLEEGSRSEEDQPTRLTAAERAAVTQILRDLRTAQAGAQGLSPAEHGALILLADARPTRKPTSVARPSEQAVRDALAAASADSDRPVHRNATAATSQAATATRGQIAQSARPAARPGNRGGDPGPGNASLSRTAVDDAVASAVANSASLPGAVALTALNSSSLPPRRSGNANRTVAAAAPTADDLRSAAQAQTEEAAIAEQRRQDDELQAQAEARARARASADAQAEAQARAAAEARARAQAEAEARAAAGRQQRYAPPEAEDEPDVAAANIPDGRTPTTAGNAATVRDGIQVNRTQIIGTVGAGKASRALVRLSNGRVLTLRLGDRINGGTITDIGDSRITFVKNGRQQALSVLGGQ